MLRPLSDEAMTSLTDALLDGRKIEAIKLYREATGLGLKESKDEIEALEASLRAQFPDKFKTVPKGKGCFGGATILVFGTAFATYWLLKR